MNDVSKMTDKEILDRLEVIYGETTALAIEKQALIVEKTLRKHNCKIGDKITYEGKAGIVTKEQDGTFLKFNPVTKDGTVRAMVFRNVYHPDKLVRG